jgi:hypothetical protein
MYVCTYVYRKFHCPAYVRISTYVCQYCALYTLGMCNRTHTEHLLQRWTTKWGLFVLLPSKYTENGLHSDSIPSHLSPVLQDVRNTVQWDVPLSNEDVPLSHGMYHCPIGCTTVLWDVPLSYGMYHCPMGCTTVLWDVPLSYGMYHCPMGCTTVPWDVPLSSGTYHCPTVHTYIHTTVLSRAQVTVKTYDMLQTCLHDNNREISKQPIQPFKTGWCSNRYHWTKIISCVPPVYRLS